MKKDGGDSDEVTTIKKSNITEGDSEMKMNDGDHAESKDNVVPEVMIDDDEYESSEDDALRKPRMAELTEEIGSDFHEEEDLDADEPWRIVPGGISAEEQEAAVLADPRFSKNREKHIIVKTSIENRNVSCYVIYLNRLLYAVADLGLQYIDGLSDKDKGDDEFSDVVDWNQDDPKAFYAPVSDRASDGVAEPPVEPLVEAVVDPIVNPWRTLWRVLWGIRPR